MIVDLGEVEIMESLSEQQRTDLKIALLKVGFELMDDKRAMLVEKIKNAIVEMIHHSDEVIKVNFSNFLSEKLKYDYNYLANLFSEVQGTTIEQFVIFHKIERIKELIIYGELNITEIAWKMNYSSVAHLSNQFKKVIGLSPSHFKKLKEKRRNPLEDVGLKNDEKLTGFIKMNNTQTKEFNYTRSLIEASLDPLVTICAKGRIMDVNEAFIKVTGVSRKKLINTNFSNYFTEPKKAKEGYLQVFENGFVADYPLTIKHKNGNLTDVLYNASVYKDNNENVLGVFAAARDVTSQKWAGDLRKVNEELATQNKEIENRAAELVIANKELAYQNNEKEKRAAELVIANKELATQHIQKIKQELASKELEVLNHTIKLDSLYSLSLIEASLDPLITISSKGKITDMNEALTKVTGLTREELKDSDFLDYFTEPKKAHNVYKEIFAKGFVTDFPLTLRHKNGNLTDVLFNGSTYKNTKGKVGGVVIVARDVTEQKKVAKELTEAMLFAEMATMLAEEAKIKAEKATLIAEDAVKAKQQFLSNMSHEIRTPMNAIIGFTKVMLKTNVSAKQKEYLKAIKLSGDALIVLINDILDLAKVNSGKMIFEKTPFKMATSISAMLQLFKPKIHEKNLKLVKIYDDKIPDVLLGDSMRLHQIVLNLVSNAVKFTSKGKITVTLKLEEEDDDNVRIKFSVSDTGIGIPNSKIETIFENFQQVSNETSRLFGGTGLGLAIVKQLVEPQGGSISVISKVDEGSTFSFTLPFQKTTETVDLELELIEYEKDVSNIKILVVEDIQLNQLLMRTLLDDFGFECDVADNGKIAIDKMQTKTYDLILMDLQMPEMNGFETTEYIRNTMHSNIPIIALTADVTTVDLAKCKAIGMDDYIAKPVDEQLLYSKMLSLIKKATIVVEPDVTVLEESVKIKCTNLYYLNTRTKSNKGLMVEMISLYLEQTPILVSTMKKSFLESDWKSLNAAVHKMIPSFSIIGLHTDYENMAKKIQKFANTMQNTAELSDLVIKLENICNQACLELLEDLNTYKNAKDE
jgi:PAS domain S-box-containing protein